MFYSKSQLLSCSSDQALIQISWCRLMLLLLSSQCCCWVSSFVCSYNSTDTSSCACRSLGYHLMLKFFIQQQNKSCHDRLVNVDTQNNVMYVLHLLDPFRKHRDFVGEAAVTSAGPLVQCNTHSLLLFEVDKSLKTILRNHSLQTLLKLY